MSLALVQQSPVSPATQVCAGLAGPECLDAIRQADPAAAQVLYTMFAEQIRTYLRRHTGIQAVESTVFDVLVEAVRSVRELASLSMGELSQTVRELSQQGVFALRRRPAVQLSAAVARSPLDADREHISGVFTVLDRCEREIVLRSVLLSEDDDEISTELALPLLQIRRTMAKARVLFRISQFGEEDVAAARA